MKGVIPQGKALRQPSQTCGSRRLSAAQLRGIKPFVSSLARSCPRKRGRDLAPFVNKPARKSGLRAMV